MHLRSFTRACLTLGFFISSGFLLQAETQLIGSGATFPAPLYSRWISDFNQSSNPDASHYFTVHYQPIGSTAGVKEFVEGHTDFGASDYAMSDEEINKMGGNVLMIPATAGMVTLAYNLDHIAGIENGLKLSREAYVGIMLGTVSKWNDPMIAKNNPGIVLPNLPITVVTRSDSSGTTSCFTSHLSEVSSTFNFQVGSGKSVDWPVGISAKGNAGVAALIKQTSGAIGYIEYGYALSNDLPMARLQNKAGNYLAPSMKSGIYALSSIVLPKNLRGFVRDPQGVNDYPITTFTWLLFKRTYFDPEKQDAVRSFLHYALNNGQDYSPGLGYLPIPTLVMEQINARLKNIYHHNSVAVGD